MDYMMVPAQYEELKDDLVEHMIVQVHENRVNDILDESDEVAEPVGGRAPNVMALDDDELMIGGMEQVIEAPMTRLADDEATLRVNC